MGEVAAVNASPLIVLAKIGRLDLLRSAAPRLVTTTGVLQEVSGPSLSDVAYLAVRALPWLEEVPDPLLPPDLVAAKLGHGESTLLAWALGATDCEVIVDDLAARQFARARGIPVRGTLAIVLAAKNAGLVPAVRPVIEALRTAGLYLSEALVADVLFRAGE